MSCPMSPFNLCFQPMSPFSSSSLLFSSSVTQQHVLSYVPIQPMLPTYVPIQPRLLIYVPLHPGWTSASSPLPSRPVICAVPPSLVSSAASPFSPARLLQGPTPGPLYVLILCLPTATGSHRTPDFCSDVSPSLRLPGHRDWKRASHQLDC